MRNETMEAARLAAASYEKKISHRPALGVVLGSGMGGITAARDGQTLAYRELPGFPTTGVQGHQGILKAEAACIWLSGRFHYYEGHSLDTVCMPVLFLHAIGVETVILCNAAGGIHHDYCPGDLALISDHINLQGSNPLIGPALEGLGPRFPDMSRVYDPGLRAEAKKLDPLLHEGVYAALSGPSYETPAEIRMLRTIGADLVGMSTVPEAIVARSLGMRVLGISMVTNKAAGLSGGILDHQEVLKAGNQAQARLGALLSALADRGRNGV